MTRGSGRGLQIRSDPQPLASSTPPTPSRDGANGDERAVPSERVKRRGRNSLRRTRGGGTMKVRNGQAAQLDLEPDLRALFISLHAPIGCERVNEPHAPTAHTNGLVSGIEPGASIM